MQEKIARSNKARTEATRAALISAARRLFVEKGYAETGTPEIVSAADVTRGALYHHFSDKSALFQAVIEAEAREVAGQIKLHTSGISDAVDALFKGAEAYFSAMKVPGRTRLLLVDGPSILGPEVMAYIDRQTGADELRIGLEQAIPVNRLQQIPLSPLADILAAAFDKAALEISRGGNEDDYRSAVEILLKGILFRE